MADSQQIDEAKRLLVGEGYAVVKAETYRRALRDRDVADARREFAEHQYEGVQRWAREHADQERFLRDRLTFVYGVAREKGATVDELRGGDEQAFTVLRYPSDPKRTPLAPSGAEDEAASGGGSS